MATKTLDTPDKARAQGIQNLLELERDGNISEKGQTFLNGLRERDRINYPKLDRPDSGLTAESIRAPSEDDAVMEILKRPLSNLELEEPIPREAAQIPTELALESVGRKFGGQLGATGGALSRVPGGTAAGRIAGSGAGGAAGAALTKLMQMLGTVSDEEPITGGDIGTSAVFGAVPEGATELIAKGVKGRKLPFLGRGLTKEGKLLTEALDKGGLKAAPSLVSDNQVVATIQNVAENGIFSAGTMSKFIQKGRDFAQSQLDNFAEKFVKSADVTPEMRLKTFVSAVKKSADIQEAIWLKGMSKLDNLTLGRPMAVGKDGERAFFLELATDITREKNVNKKLALKKSLQKSIDRLKENPAIGRVQVEAIDNILNKLGSPKVAQGLNNAMVNAIVRKEGVNPEFYKRILFRPNAAEDIRAFKKMVSPKQWKNVEASFIKDAMFKSLDEDKTGALFVNGKKLGKVIRDLSGGGAGLRNDQTFKTLFTDPADSARFEKLAKILDKSQSKAPTGIGSMAIQMIQSGALIGLASGVGSLFGAGTAAGVGTSAVVLLGPVALAKAMTSPGVINVLTEGAKGTNLAKTSLVNRLIAQLQKERIDFDLVDSPDDAKRVDRDRVRRSKIEGGINDLFPSGLNSL